MAQTFIPTPSKPVLIMNAHTNIGEGDVRLQIERVGAGDPMHFNWVVQVTGSPAAMQVNFEGTLDGVAWFPMDISNTLTSEMRMIVQQSALYVRSNLITLTGGTSPTVTVTAMCVVP